VLIPEIVDQFKGCHQFTAFSAPGPVSEGGRGASPALVHRDRPAHTAILRFILSGQLPHSYSERCGNHC
jgi:hypothetical protein